MYTHPARKTQYNALSIYRGIFFFEDLTKDTGYGLLCVNAKSCPSNAIEAVVVSV